MATDLKENIVFRKSKIESPRLKSIVKATLLGLTLSIVAPQVSWAASWSFDVTYRNATSGTATTTTTCATATTPSPGSACSVSVSRYEYTSLNTALWQATGLTGGGYTFGALSGADAGDFTLSGGTLTFASNPNWEAPADADTNNIYVTTLLVSKNGTGADNGTTFYTTITFTITILNIVDETAPTITPADTTATVSEGSTSAIIDFNANEDVTWALSGTDENDFLLNADGVLTWVSTPDYDNPTDTNANGQNTYSITVTATDSASGNPGGAWSTTRNFAVTVTNAAPTINVIYAFDLVDYYDYTDYWFVYAVANEDIDVWSLTGPDAQYFDILDSDSSYVLVNPNIIFDFERPVDANKDGIYEFVINATDEHGASSSESVALSVYNITDEDAPKIVGPSSVSVVEGGSLANALATYLVINEPVFSEVYFYGDDSDFFCLDEQSADRYILRLCDNVAFEDYADLDGDNVFELIIGVYDDFNYTEFPISVTLLSSGVSEEPEVSPEEQAKQEIIDAVAANKLLKEVFSELVASAESAVTSSGLSGVKTELLTYLGLPGVTADNVATILAAYANFDPTATLSEFKDFAAKYSVMSRMSDSVLAKGVTITDLVNAGLLPSGTTADGMLMLKLRETPLEQRDTVAELQALISTLK